jgi:hypothetical protein
VKDVLSSYSRAAITGKRVEESFGVITEIIGCYQDPAMGTDFDDLRPATAARYSFLSLQPVALGVE